MAKISPLLALSALLCATPAQAESISLSTPAAPPSAPAPSPAMAKAGYSLPMLMRPVAAPKLLRFDAAIAQQDKAVTTVPVLTGAYPVAREIGLFGRLGLVNQSNAGPSSAASIANPFVFGQYVPALAGPLKVALFLGSSIPIGEGGGNSPDAKERAAVGAGIYGRQGMDNAMFAVNYLTPATGFGVAYIKSGLTAQLDATVLQLMRVRGDQVDKDTSRTNFTAATHLGYRVVDFAIIGAEFHYQRWLSTPAAVEKNGNLRQQATVGANIRFSAPLNQTTLLRPSIGYFVGVDKPMTDTSYRIVQIDFPVLF